MARVAVGRMDVFPCRNLAISDLPPLHNTTSTNPDSIPLRSHTLLRIHIFRCHLHGLYAAAVLCNRSLAPDDPIFPSQTNPITLNMTPSLRDLRFSLLHNTSADPKNPLEHLIYSWIVDYPRTTAMSLIYS